MKHKVSAFYFTIGTLPAKYRSHDIHLPLFAPSALITKHGNDKVLENLISDFKKFEAEGIQILTEHQSYLFHGTITLVIDDNSAAHALGGFFL